MFFQVLGNQQPSCTIQISHRSPVQEISSELPNFGVKIIQLTDPGKNGFPTFHWIETQAFFKPSVHNELCATLFRQLFFKANREKEATFGVQCSFEFTQKTNHL